MQTNHHTRLNEISFRQIIDSLSHIGHLSLPKWGVPEELDFSVAFNPLQGVALSKNHSLDRGHHLRRPGFKIESRGGLEVISMTQDRPYNYENYLPYEGEEGDFAKFQQTLKVGTEAPDFEATRLEDGKKINLSDLTAQSDVVLEFGSLT